MSNWTAMLELEYIIFVTKRLPFILLVLCLRLAYGYSNTVVPKL